ncbi:MarR family winged helix-turn-helix transcriptional regulator [Kineococcus sp. SYSU DK006]|uniref:MarR family winged helix-turn-helix transcriptional regulator n=1 Tax=Kineococcus sp. SYSU DK006 TaxID=3383127 RepID=UPI003D7EE229
MTPDAPDPDAPDPDAPATGLADMICFDLYSASRAMTGVYRPLLEPLGLTYPQYLVVVALHERGEVSVRELVAALDLDYGTVSPLLKRLQQNGVVDRRRSESDERTVLVQLTAAGRDLHARTRHVPDAVRAALGLDVRQTEALHHVLRSITERNA